MISFPPSVKIYIAAFPVDMRKAFNGLAAIVQWHMKLDPFSGYLFVFINKRKNRVKILFWDRDGYAIYYKRLEKGQFNFSFKDAEASVTLNHFELNLILEGVDISSIRRTPRFALPTNV